MRQNMLNEEPEKEETVETIYDKNNFFRNSKMKAEDSEKL